MGQYHLTINLDKREFLSPHTLGDGLKLLEQGLSGPGGITTALHVLLAVSNGRGGGDYNDGVEYRYSMDPAGGPGKSETIRHPFADLAESVVGRWGGDRIAIVGDYAEDGDLPEGMAPIAYALCGTHESAKESISWAREKGDDAFADQLQAQLDAHGPFTDIAPLVREYLENCDAYYHTFSYGNGGGWVERKFELERRAGV